MYEAKLGYMEEVSDEISSYVGILMMWSLLPTELVSEHHLNMHHVPWLTSASSLGNWQLSITSLPNSPDILPSPEYTLEGNCFPDNCQLSSSTSCLVGNRQSQQIGRSADTPNLHESSQVTIALLCFTAKNLGCCLMSSFADSFLQLLVWYVLHLPEASCDIGSAVRKGIEERVWLHFVYSSNYWAILFLKHEFD